MKSKKIILISIIALLVVGILFLGIQAHKKNAGAPMPEGFWTKKKSQQPAMPDSEEYQKLMALGYLQGYNPIPEKSNVTVFNKDLTYNGLNFYLSGHAPEAFLINMDGKVLHKWHYKIATKVWPEATKKKTLSHFWRRAHLYENGNILAIFSKNGLIKLDKNSRLIWKWTSPKKPHHDLQVTEDGTIFVLTSERRSVHGIPDDLTVYEDFITILNHEGTLVKHISLFDLLRKSPYAGIINYEKIKKSAQTWGELFHTNTLVVFDGTLESKSSLFKKGNIMVSILWLNTIFIIDMESEKMVWAMGSGMWTRQHQPELLKNGNMLIFNNIYKPDASRVIEFEPFTQKIVWDFKGDSKNSFYSMTCGSNQRLPNDNTLITETDNGRVIEVNKDREIVWEFVNPLRAGEKNELIPTILEMIRISPDYCLYLTDNINESQQTSNNIQ